MMSGAILARLQQRAAQADALISHLKQQVKTLHDAAVLNACKKEEDMLIAENTQLKAEVEKLKKHLIDAELQNGKTQVPMPQKVTSTPAVTAPTDQPEIPSPIPEQAKPQKQQKKEKKESKPKQPPKAAAPELPVDVSRLDMRVGQIVSVKKHPEADTLYVEEVNVGEDRNRTIVSGLVNHIPIEQMQDRVAVFICNLKPAKMRGILSEGMIMCGSTPEKVEVIEPPAGAQIGQNIAVEGFPGTADALLNPKKKIWEQVAPDLKINEDGVATYKGIPWKISNLDGLFKVSSLKSVIIK